MVVVGVVVNPWRFVNMTGTFIKVLSAFDLSVSPLLGINCVDFWMVRRLRWNVPDVHKENSESIYWYTVGLNWRGFLLGQSRWHSSFLGSLSPLRVTSLRLVGFRCSRSLGLSVRDGLPSSLLSSDTAKVFLAEVSSTTTSITSPTTRQTLHESHDGRPHRKEISPCSDTGPEEEYAKESAKAESKEV